MPTDWQPVSHFLKKTLPRFYAACKILVIKNEMGPICETVSAHKHI